MRKSTSIAAMLILATATLLPTAGNATGQQVSTGWVSSYEVLRMSHQLKKQGLVPVKIACKGDSSSSFIRDSIMVNITFAPATEHRPWKWVWGTDMGHYTHYLMPKGWTLVSQSGFTRPKTGLFVPCGLFYGPPGTSVEYGPPSH